MRVQEKAAINDSDSSRGQNGKPSGFFAPVAVEESGQKLLQFLTRRLNFPQSLLHRWIRTGQIRVNGKRCKPFERLVAGDNIRVPPFASGMDREYGEESAIGRSGESLKFIGRHGDLAVLDKPRGLPVQPGSGHSDCVSTRLREEFAAALFKPVPCHRLDKDTTGALLVAMSFSALRQSQEYLRSRLLHKEYLAWVHGRWNWREDRLLRHFLRREKQQGKTLTRVSNEPLPYSQESVCAVRVISAASDKSLLQIRLLTGRTHQIRAQLACTGFPVIGDGKYGASDQALLLHSLRLVLPDGYEFLCLPDWQDGYRVEDVAPFWGAWEDFSRLPAISTGIGAKRV